MINSSPNRRHGTSRGLHRKWDDVAEWPFQFIILPVLVAFAFCLVLFLGSKHGTRLAAFRTWFPAGCSGGNCAKVVAVDSQGGIVTGISGVGTAAGSTVGVGLQDALSGITGLLRVDTQRAGASNETPVDDVGLLPLSPEDQLKFDFKFWIAAAEKLIGLQPRDCEFSYGWQYVDRWRKARLDWCTADDPEALGGLAPPRGNGSDKVPGGDAGRRRRLDATGVSSGNTTTGGSASAASPLPDGQELPSGVPLVPSTISLYPFHDKDSFLMVAESTNTVLDARSFLGSLPRELPEGRPGSYRAACRVGQSGPGPEYMQLESVRRWTSDALQTRQYGNVSAACAVDASSGAQPKPGGPVLQPVLLLPRLDSTNAFRTVEEAVTAFISLAVLGDPEIAANGLQVVIADGKTDGFYLDLWASLSRPYPLRILSRSPWPPNTCLKRAVQATFDGASILTSMGVYSRTSCRSSVVIATALWLRHMMGPAAQPAARGAFSSQLQNKAVVRKSVIWISRRNFEGLAQANLTPWQDQRRFENEGEVVLELQREVWRWNDGACLRSGLTKSFGAGRRRGLLGLLRGMAAEPELRSAELGLQGAGQGGGGGAATRQPTRGPGDLLGLLAGGGATSTRGGRRLQTTSRCRQSNVFFDLRVIELNDIPFYPDQVQILSQATVLAGAHGTGLANMIWMAPGQGGVLELHHNSAGNDHYHNQAHLLGHKYVHVESDGDRVDLPAAAEGLRKLLDELGTQ